MDQPLIVGVDGSEPSLRALDWAVDEAVAQGVPLRVVPRTATIAARGALRDAPDARAGSTPRREVVEGHARTVLLDAARTARARRREGHLGMRLGPVNHTVLHHAACPVAVVPRG
ncbi:universal stress protein [Streptomyces arenae]|nr:universal stress protein [Streptomyces arenae]